MKFTTVMMASATSADSHCGRSGYQKFMYIPTAVSSAIQVTIHMYQYVQPVR